MASPMAELCACGMLLEPAARRTGCVECGAPGCPSCSMQVEAITYCRWCATSLAAAGA